MQPVNPKQANKNPIKSATASMSKGALSDEQKRLVIAKANAMLARK